MEMLLIHVMPCQKSLVTQNVWIILNVIRIDFLTEVRSFFQKAILVYSLKIVWYTECSMIPTFPSMNTPIPFPIINQSINQFHSIPFHFVFNIQSKLSPLVHILFPKGNLIQGLSCSLIISTSIHKIGTGSVGLDGDPRHQGSNATGDSSMVVIWMWEVIIIIIHCCVNYKERKMAKKWNAVRKT